LIDGIIRPIFTPAPSVTPEKLLPFDNADLKSNIVKKMHT
jgi:hypothetical protein